MTTYEVTAWRLHYADGSSNKFYNVFALNDGTVILNWGRTNTSGQTKIEKYTQAEAQIIAKRQVFAKAGKGYKIVLDEFVFAIEEGVYKQVVVQNWGTITLDRALDAALKESQFAKQQALVTTHYDTFIEKTNQVLDAAAAGEDFDSLLDQWQHLSQAWTELADKHDHAKAAVGMVQQVVSQRLMGV